VQAATRGPPVNPAVGPVHYTYNFHLVAIPRTPVHFTAQS
jgi:hypothetical protein